ncbi:MAG: ATP-binding protein [Desulfobulbaceae bacterium]|jgi:PAS domain S-box-containing protein|nr:ATP-binding protein [Desulfobulbaceae bacterium]
MRKLLRRLLLLDHDFTAEEQDLEFKLIFLNTIFLSTAVIAFVMAFVRWQDHAGMGLVDFLFVVINLGLFFYLRAHREKVDLIANLTLCLSFLLFSVIYLLASYNFMRLALFFLFLAGAFFLKGRKSAFLWLILILATIISVHFIPVFSEDYSHLDIFTTSLYLTAMFFVLNTYDKSKENRERLIKKLNLHLEDEVEQRTVRLKESEALLLATIESLPFEFFVVDQSGRYIMQNSICRKNWGGIIGKRTEDLDVAETTLSQWIENNQRSLAGEIIDGEVRFETPNGERVYHNIISPIHSEDSIIGIIGVNIDITERRDVERRLQTSQAQLVQAGKLAAIGELAAGVSHELNQPLMVLRSRSQLMQRRQAKQTLTPEYVAGVLESFERNTKRMMNIINHLRTFSRQSDQGMVPVDLNKVVGDSFYMIGEQLKLRNIKVSSDLAEDLPRVQGDASQLEQVILNLLANGRDAVAERWGQEKGMAAAIQIRTMAAGDRVILEVEDNGTGIPADKLDKIFEPFVTTKVVGKGTGLGLSISYGIIEAHGGNIQVTESSPEGTIFRVDLPVAPPANA